MNGKLCTTRMRRGECMIRNFTSRHLLVSVTISNIPMFWLLLTSICPERCQHGWSELVAFTHPVCVHTMMPPRDPGGAGAYQWYTRGGFVLERSHDMMADWQQSKRCGDRQFSVWVDVFAVVFISTTTMTHRTSSPCSCHFVSVTQTRSWAAMCNGTWRYQTYKMTRVGTWGAMHHRRGKAHGFLSRGVSDLPRNQDPNLYQSSSDSKTASIGYYCVEKGGKKNESTAKRTTSIIFYVKKVQSESQCHV